MSLVGHIAVDWRRYGITDCQWEYPWPVELIGWHAWEFQRHCLMGWTWDLGRVEILFPPGYRFDGGSIPVRAGGIVDPIAALIGSGPHDILYETCAGARPYRVWGRDGVCRDECLYDAATGASILFDGNNPPNPERRRARADAVLRAFWVASGMPEDMADIGYATVRAFGRRAWESLEPPTAAQAITPPSQELAA